MRVLICAGDSSDSLLASVKKKFSDGSVEFDVEPYLDNVDDFLNRGGSFNRVLITAQGICKNDNDISEAMSTIANFVNVMNDRQPNSDALFVIGNDLELLDIAYDGCYSLGSRVCVMKLPDDFRITVNFLVRICIVPFEGLENDPMTSGLTYNGTSITVDDTTSVGVNNNFTEMTRVSDLDEEIVEDDIDLEDDDFEDSDDFDNDFSIEHSVDLEEPEELEPEELEPEQEEPELEDLDNLNGDLEISDGDMSEGEVDDSGFEDNDLDLSGLDLDSDLGDFNNLDGDFENNSELENDLEDFESSNEDDLDSLDSNLDDLSDSEFTEDENSSLPDLCDFDIDNSTEELDSLDDFETKDGNFETEGSDTFDTSDFGDIDIPEDESTEDNFENEDDFATSDDFEDSTEFDNEDTDSLDEPEQEETYEEENSIANDLFDIDETEESSDTDELFETEPEEEEQEIEEEEAEIVNTSVSDNNSNASDKSQRKGLFGRNRNNRPAQNQQQQSGFSQVEMAELRKMLDTYNRRGHCMVVSGTSNSGSTTLAGNIANVVASLGYTVAIVDFDLSKRGQTYLSKDAFLAVNNSGDNYSDTLMKVINNKNSNISANGAIIKAGLNLFGTNVEEDTPDIEKVIKGQDKLRDFIYNLKSIYNFIVFDCPVEYLESHLAELVIGADSLVLTVEQNNKSLLELTMRLVNIDDYRISRDIFNRAKIVVSKSNGTSGVALGKKYNSYLNMMSLLDKHIYDVTGNDTGGMFTNLRVVSSIPYINGLDSYIYNKGYFSDTKDGKELYLKVLSNIMIK